MIRHGEEDVFHVLMGYAHAVEVWGRLGFRGIPGFDATDQFLWMKRMVSTRKTTFFLAALWWVWCWWKNDIFETSKWTLDLVLRKIATSNDDFLNYMGPESIMNPNLLKRVAPVRNELKMNWMVAMTQTRVIRDLVEQFVTMHQTGRIDSLVS
ncbi:hypothetical protein RJT34_15882 [Clitoria ternatea]|uniref:Uncharacterized protein n=1 Tax=Clitoria ternatea TaxID=43366 RepID=A0AAN9J687_CLITE